MLVITVALLKTRQTSLSSTDNQKINKSMFNLKNKRLIWLLNM
jgi:hypothetical protein